MDQEAVERYLTAARTEAGLSEWLRAWLAPQSAEVPA
jgi:hypothetical protein